MRTKKNGNEWLDCLIKLQDFYNNVWIKWFVYQTTVILIVFKGVYWDAYKPSSSSWSSYGLRETGAQNRRSTRADIPGIGEECLGLVGMWEDWRMVRIKVRLYKINIGQFSAKELSLSHKLKFANLYIFATWKCKPLIFQTWVIWSNSCLKCLRSTTLACIRKSKFVANTQFLCSNI